MRCKITAVRVYWGIGAPIAFEVKCEVPLEFYSGKGEALLIRFLNMEGVTNLWFDGQCSN